MPLAFRRKLTELLQLCTELLATLAEARIPTRAQVGLLADHLRALEPRSPADPFMGTWLALNSAETLLGIAADESNGDRHEAARLSEGHLRVARRNIEDLLD